MSVRLANAQGRGSLVIGGGLVDVERASKGRFSPDPMALLERWDVFLDWARGIHEGQAGAGANEGDFGPPVPRPVDPLAFQPPKELMPGQAPVVAPARRLT